MARRPAETVTVASRTSIRFLKSRVFFLGCDSQTLLLGILENEALRLCAGLAENLAMRYTPRQIAVRGREAAGLLVATLDRDAYVMRFLRGYANDHDRPGIITQPILHRDLMGTVRREALLAMATHVDELAPQFLGLGEGASPSRGSARGAAKGKAGRGSARVKSGTAVKGRAGTTRGAGGIAAKRGTEIARQSAAEAEALNLFREEVFAALGQALRWTQSDFEEFARDYDLYESAGAHDAASRRGAKAGASGPFVDRCGLLIDPSMLEQARRAAGKFETLLRGVTLQALKRVFATRREN